MNSFIDYLQEVVYSYANGDFHLRVLSNENRH